MKLTYVHFESKTNLQIVKAREAYSFQKNLFNQIFRQEEILNDINLY